MHRRQPDPIAATPQTATEYVTHLTTAPSLRTGRPLAPSSIERALDALRTAHKAADLPTPETKGVRRAPVRLPGRLAETRGPAARTRKACAAVPDALRAMLALIDRTTLAGARDAALLLLGYATAARVSELAALDVADLVETEDGLLVTLYRRKLKRHDEVVVPYGATPPPAPCGPCAPWWPI